MAFSIIIPSRNIDNLTKCVSAIRAAGEDCTVIVVDDGIDWQKANPLYSAEIEMILAGSQPFCFARNVNIGIRAAGSADMFLWNDDALLIGRTERPLTTMVRAIQYSTQIEGNAWGVVSCAVKGHPGPAYPQTNRHIAELYPDVDPSLWPVRQPYNQKMVPFTAVYIPRRALDMVGLLDERFTGIVDGYEVYGGEDEDWCLRARRCGFYVGVWDGALVNHATLPSTGRPDGKGRSIAGAQARFREIHGFQMGTR